MGRATLASSRRLIGRAELFADLMVGRWISQTEGGRSEGGPALMIDSSLLSSLSQLPSPSPSPLPSPPISNPSAQTSFLLLSSSRHDSAKRRRSHARAPHKKDQPSHPNQPQTRWTTSSRLSARARRHSSSRSSSASSGSRTARGRMERQTLPNARLRLARLQRHPPPLTPALPQHLPLPLRRRARSP